MNHKMLNDGWTFDHSVPRFLSRRRETEVEGLAIPKDIELTRCFLLEKEVRSVMRAGYVLYSENSIIVCWKRTTALTWNPRTAQMLSIHFSSSTKRWWIGAFKVVSSKYINTTASILLNRKKFNNVRRIQKSAQSQTQYTSSQYSSASREREMINFGDNYFSSFILLELPFPIWPGSDKADDKS